jgi:hypothetical protein
MDRDMCPHCGADLQAVGVREYGLVNFQYLQTWNPELQMYEGFKAEPLYGDCTFNSHRCHQCEIDLGFHPNDEE